MAVFDLEAIISLNDGEFKSGLSKAGKALGTFAKVTGAAIAAGSAAVVKIAKDSVEAYANYEQLSGGVETLFKNSANVVQEYAANAYKTSGLSANEYMETVTSFSASLLQSLGGDTEAAAKMADMAIVDMSDNANKMGTDIASIQTAYQGFAKQNYTMLDNLKLGYGGTKTEMERLVSDAEKLNSSFKAQRDANGNLALSYADVVDAIHIVQDSMGITGTTAKEASTTIQGSLASAKSAFQNLLVGIADESQDFDKLVDNFVDSVVTAGDNLLPRIQKILEGIAKLIVTAAPKLVPIAVDLIVDNLPLLIQCAIEIVKALVTGLVQATPEILKAIYDLMTMLIEAVGEKLGELVDKGAEFVQKLREGISERFNDLVTAAVEKFEDIKAGIQEKLNAIKTVVVTLVSSIVAVGVARFQAFKDGITQKITAAKDAVKGVIDKIKGLFNFKLELPHIALPHFSWSWNDLGIIKIPNLSVEWYNKAYDQPYLFNKPTVMSGFGDGTGDEMVYGKSSLLNDIRTAMRDVTSGKEEQPINIVVQSVLDGRVIGETAYKYQRNMARAIG